MMGERERESATESLLWLQSPSASLRGCSPCGGRGVEVGALTHCSPVRSSLLCGRPRGGRAQSCAPSQLHKSSSSTPPWNPTTRTVLNYQARTRAEGTVNNLKMAFGGLHPHRRPHDHSLLGQGNYTSVLVPDYGNTENEKHARSGKPQLRTRRISA